MVASIYTYRQQFNFTIILWLRSTVCKIFGTVFKGHLRRYLKYTFLGELLTIAVMYANFSKKLSLEIKNANNTRRLGNVGLGTMFQIAHSQLNLIIYQMRRDKKLSKINLLCENNWSMSLKI